MRWIASDELEGKAILFVERSHFIARDIYRAFESLGATILGPVSTTREAALLLDFLEIDGAVVDRDLTEDSALLTLLKDREVPSVFSCNEPTCRSGKNGCYRLDDVRSDPAHLLERLFLSAVH
ncbi:hypothetical protein IHQ71_07790 [Rhizobium sp. TH2]|uniref:hypothetical protein n=1 Tax=Rhizobium sp. TH2 TaxID=2775403 RepID=UPI002156FFDA|nr:hypothetical protein [Rhizobium sp. TH2]UVC10489.1 hypothetical protein IHQ71_07790 [Rhizobium sp. TH2]